MKTTDWAILLLLGAIWGASYLFIRIAVPAFGAFPLVGIRVTLAAIVLGIGLRASGRRFSFRPYAGRLLILGAINAAIPFTLISAAELHITASLAAMLTAITPLWAAVFSAIWLDEPLSARRVGGLLLGVVGVSVLVGWSPILLNPTTMLAIAALIVATCAYGGVGVFTKRKLSGVPAPTLALGQQLGAIAWLFVPALWTARDVHPTAPAAAALLTLAIVCTAAAYLLFFKLLASAGPTKTTTVTYLVPVFGTAWGAIFLHEPVTWGMLLGLAFIFASVVAVNQVAITRSTKPWRILGRSVRESTQGSP
jgi:drug/metabolite transporter (DMT)-like permease